MDYIKLGKELAYALRHAPHEYNLDVDEDGFVLCCDLLNAINEKSRYERKITFEDLKYVEANSNKRRYEIKNNKIRALYGHTIKKHINKEASLPPDVLYHGTSHSNLELILKEGLKPMNRQYVHLSLDVEMATQVGLRRDKDPVILKIDAKSATLDKVVFYVGNDRVWLTDYISPKYISILK